MVGCGGSARHASQGIRAGDARPGRLHDRDHERVLADGAGDRLVYRETDGQGGEQRVEVTVTDRTKTIMGIEARVVHDVVSEDGQVVEDTFDWYAQDADGNIWYLGEDTKEYENGKLTTTEGSWEAGVDGAQPGIILPANPEPGLEYRQEYYEDEAEDAARCCSSTSGWRCRSGSYGDVLHDEGLHAARARGPRAQVLREGRRPGARAHHLRRLGPRGAARLAEVEAVDEPLEHVLVPAVHEVCVEPELPRGEPRSLRHES